MTGEAVLEAGRGEPQTTRLSLMRRAMVRQSIAGAAVPVFYLRMSADVTELVARRRELRSDDPESTLPTINDAVVHATAAALRAHPEVNSSYVDGTVESYPRVNVGIAVAVEGGLVVPAIYDADCQSLAELAQAAREVTDLARRRKLSREMLADATFSVSNLGMFGIEDFDPLINPPNAAILGVGTATTSHDGRQLLRLTLGCDHRALTGAEGALFLGTLKAGIERAAGLLSPAGPPAAR